MTRHYWTFVRKAAIVRDVATGRSALDNVLAAHEISPEEFEYWRAAFARGGAAALRVTKIEPRRGPSYRPRRYKPRAEDAAQ